MKRKSNHKKAKKEEIEVKEVGTFNDFLIMEKEKKDNDDSNDLSFLKDWINLENPFSDKAKNKSKKSRFCDLFKEIEKEEKENKNKKEEDIKKKEEEDLKKEEEKPKKEEETLKKEDSLKKNISFTSSTANTNVDSKLFESFSGNDSSLENSNSINTSNSINSINSINQIKDNKKAEQNETEEINLNLDINKVISLEDKRTTIMIKNIPNKFNKDLLLSIINQNFKGTYDLFILPTDVNKYKNFGYAFINFTCSYYIPYFYYMFNGKMWSSTNSKKVCELTYSKVQGKNNLLGHYPIKIVFWNEEASNVTPNQKYIIPNVYKIIFNKCFPKEIIEEYKFYFITKMPGQD